MSQGKKPLMLQTLNDVNLKKLKKTLKVPF
jgi:hypothetical protein